jgi:hypothetical protein
MNKWVSLTTGLGLLASGDLIGSRPRWPPAEHVHPKRNREHPKDERDKPVDRECQQESQHDQDGTYSD